MFARTYTAFLSGIQGRMTAVETYISNGLPGFHIVGLTDTVIKESAERIRAAINSSNLGFPIRRIAVNLTPADRRKSGGHYDLAIAMSLLKAARDDIDFVEEDFAFFGELSLDGSIRGVPGILPLAMCAEENDIKNIIVPEENICEASFVKNSRVIGVSCLWDAIDAVKGRLSSMDSLGEIKNRKSKEEMSELDFSQVFGQETAKRAALLAAAGGHDMLMMGSPGVGKSMIARRLPGLLPAMTYEECREVTKIYSIAGLLDRERPAIFERPFRKPHGSVSRAALIGGGAKIRPGEISLAHLGVLFLDELNTFQNDCLEALRQPVEERKVQIIRNRESVVFPADFILVCAVNPCPCGYLGNDERICQCTETQISSFRRKLSGPLLDRIDLHVTMAPVKYEEIGIRRNGIDTNTMKEKVFLARRMQKERYGENLLNGRLDDDLAREKIKLGKEEINFIKEAGAGFGMSARSLNKLIRIGRTVADVEGSFDVKVEHLAEALSYRSFFDMYGSGEMSVKNR